MPGSHHHESLERADEGGGWSLEVVLSLKTPRAASSIEDGTDCGTGDDVGFNIRGMDIVT